MKRSLALGLAIALALPAGAARAEEPRPPRPPAPPRRDGPPPSPRPEGGSDGTAPRVPGAGDIVTIKGRIVNDSGNPLPARLTIEVRGEFPGTEKRVRDATPPADDGTFTVDDLLNGRKYEVVVESSNFTRWTTVVAAGTQDAVVHLRPMRFADGTIRGRVLGVDGKAVGAGMEVSAGINRHGWSCVVGNGDYSSTRTLADGTFVLEFLGGPDFSVTARTGDEPTDLMAHAFRIPEGSSGVVLRLDSNHAPDLADALRQEPSPHVPAPSAITGRLLTPRGTALPEDFNIQAHQEESGTNRTFYPSPKGFFDTGTLPPGKWSLKAVAPSRLVVGEAKDVVPGARDIEIRLDSRGTIEGRVDGVDGKPVGADVRVEAFLADEDARFRPGGSSMTRTRADGTFLIEFLEGTAFSVRTWPDPNPRTMGMPPLSGPVVKNVAPGTVDVSLRLALLATANGFLKGTDDRPLPAVEIFAYSEERDCWDHTTTGKDGAFSLREVAAGRLRLYTGREGARVELGVAEAPFKDLVLKVPAK